MTDNIKDAARLVASCPDRPGIVSAVSKFLFDKGANIIHSDQHSTDPEGGRFFLRQEFYAPGMNLVLEDFKSEFEKSIAEKFEMDWRITPSWEKKKVVILVSKFDHALMDLLWRNKRNELFMDITKVISNHPDLKKSVEAFDVPFEHVQVTKETKLEAEVKIAKLCQGADFLILARYMQILSSGFVGKFENKIINIHHSFLPAFVGADPYTRAFERGVKLIGATAHYVTDQLDQGPIIAQDVIPVTHRDTAADMKALGRDIERQVLAKAIKWHIEDRIIVYGNKTIIF